MKAQLQTGKVTTKGQVTIPAEYREELDIPPGTIVKFFLLDDVVILKPADPVSKLYGSLKDPAKKKQYGC